MSKFETASPAMSAAMFHKTTSGNVKESELINSGRDTTVQKSYNVNIAVFPDVMSFIQFAAQHFVAWTRSANGKALGHDPVDISDIIPPDPSTLPVSSIADMYTRSMLRRRVGYPLYEPDPFSQLSKEYLRNGVNIGDVGFIREDGAFDFLFNICPPQNTFINPPNLPDGFSLESPAHSETRTMKPLARATRLFPPTVTRTISGEYLCEESEGAILELPEGAIQAEAINRGQFEALAKLHGVQWYKYTMTLGRSISNGSLYLVTSFTKCTQWGIGIFDRRCDPGQGLTFVSSPLRWESSGGFSTKVADPSQGDTPNQCVFLRGYKIMICQDIFDALPRRQRAQRIRGGGGSDFVSRILKGGNSLAWTKPSTMKKSNEVVLHANFNLSPLHPSDLINVALLSQNPDAKLALMHDDVWCDVLRDNFPKLNYMTLMNIAQSYRSSIDEHGCVSLQKISDSNNTPDERSNPVQGHEIPLLQESMANTDPKAAIEPTSIHIPSQLPRKASAFHKAIAKVKNLIPRPSYSHVATHALSRHPSERAKYQQYLGVLVDTTGKPNIDDKAQSIEIKNDLGEPLKPAELTVIHMTGRGVEMALEYDIQTTTVLDKGQDGEYSNALQAASYKGAKDIVELLLDKGADVNAQGGVYGNALQAASCKGAKDIVELLLDTGADVNAQGGVYGNALQAASYNGAKDIVELLLDKGAFVNAQGGMYDNALQAASYNGIRDIVELLLDKGADVNAQGGEYGNALQAASYNGAKDIVELLLNQGADVNAQGGKYGNALQAASYKSTKDIVELLLNKDADVNARCGKYGTALQAASHKGAKDIVELLLDKGADVSAQGGKYGNALQAASHMGVKDIVELLLNKGADVNARCGKYGNALQAASHKGAKDIVELLLDKGADVNARSSEYDNASKGVKDILLPPITMPASSLSVMEDPQSPVLPPLQLPLLTGLASDEPVEIPTLEGWVGGPGSDGGWYSRPSQGEGQPQVGIVAIMESILHIMQGRPGPGGPTESVPVEFHKIQHKLNLSEQAEHTENDSDSEGASSLDTLDTPPVYRRRLQKMTDRVAQAQPVFLPGTVGGGDPASESWYRPPQSQPLRHEDGVPAGQPEFTRRESTSVPLPPGPTYVQIPPIFEQLMSVIRESHLAQTATYQQQQDLARYMRELNEWLARDVNDRHDELNAITARLDILTMLTNALLSQHHDSSVDESEESGSQQRPYFATEISSTKPPYHPWTPPPSVPLVRPVALTPDPRFTPVIPAAPPLPRHDKTARLDILASIKNALSRPPAVSPAVHHPVIPRTPEVDFTPLIPTPPVAPIYSQPPPPILSTTFPPVHPGPHFPPPVTGRSPRRDSPPPGPFIPPLPDTSRPPDDGPYQTWTPPPLVPPVALTPDPRFTPVIRQDKTARLDILASLKNALSAAIFSRLRLRDANYRLGRPKESVSQQHPQFTGTTENPTPVTNPYQTPVPTPLGAMASLHTPASLRKNA